MTYNEVKCDLFSYYPNYNLAQCISADFEMGAGIALEFNKRLNTKSNLMSKYPTYLKTYKKIGGKGSCLYDQNVYNLVTKERYFDKPTYESIRIALECMKYIMVTEGETRIAMPKIGCGLDRLNWRQVSLIIQDVFRDTNIDIIVCYL